MSRRKVGVAQWMRGLNPEQRKAVETTEGPVLVLAGAGTGKTRVITVRIAHMLEKGVSPESVLAVTFTNKAAGEMRERVIELVGKEAGELLTIGTFHRFCLMALRGHLEEAGLPGGFTICDASDQLSAMRGALRELRIPDTGVQPNVALSRISLAKNRMQTADEYLARAGDDLEELIGRAWKRYEAHLERSRALDFDDMLVRTVQLLRNPDVLREFRERYRYVLIDEYQDTNAPQYEIVKAVAGEHRNLCVVGDDDQSIYGWRGADVTKILNFENDFPEAEVVRLETNYRSTKPILRAANRVIRNNPQRHEKELRSALGDGAAVGLMVLEDETAEAEYVVREIHTLERHGEAQPQDFAILFRAAVQARTFEAELRARSVPYVLVGGMSFFDRKEVRDVLAYVKLAHNPDDEVSLLRVINTPPRGIGKTQVERILAFAAQEGISAAAALERADEIEGLRPSSLEAYRLFRDKLTRFGAEKPKQDLVVWLKRFLDALDYRSEVDRVYPDTKTREDRWSSVSEIFNFAENYVTRSSRPTLGGFLDRLVLNADDRNDDIGDHRRAVTLMTLHAAKGLEFPRVFLVGLEEGFLPHTRSVAEDTVEEERRLMYVGVTRAQRVLTLTLTKSRARYGTRVVTMPSRFLYEMKDEPPPPEWIPAGASDQEKARKKAAGKKRTRKKATRKKTTRRRSRG